MTLNAERTAAQILAQDIAATRRIGDGLRVALERLKAGIATALAPRRASPGAVHVAAPQVYEDLYHPHGSARKG